MKLRLVLTILLLVLVGTGILFWFKRGGPASMTTNSQTPAAGQEDAEDEYSYLPVPHISMRINGTHEPAVYQGTPLLVSLRTANPAAINAEMINQAHKQRWTALQEKLAKGQVRQQDADALSANLQRQIPVKSVELGGENIPWEQFVRFLQRLPDGKELPLPWPLQRIGAEPLKMLVLDAKMTGQLDFGLNPEAAASIAPGEYTIVGILEVPPEAKLSAEQWRGRVETEPVTLKILPQQAQRSPEEKTKSELEYVNYFLKTNQAAQALWHAREALAASPTSIDAYIAVGDSKNMQGDAQGALDAYEAALTAFYNRQNLPYEPPSLLTHKISMLQEKLAAKP